MAKVTLFRSEHDEQALLAAWASFQRSPVRLLFAIPNGGFRHPATARRLRAEGVKPGVPDMFLPVPVAPFAGLFIEMKSKHGRLRREQAEMCEELRKQGYAVAVCRGCEEAKQVIMSYLAGKLGDAQTKATKQKGVNYGG